MRHARGLIPCRTGKGFLLVASVALAGLFASVSAHAASVPVHLKVSIGEPATTAAVIADCPVTVAAGANGVAVLDAAKATGCISSYELRSFSGLGHYVSCVDGVCQTTNLGSPGDADGLVSYWRYAKNGAFSDVGVDGFNAKSGDVLGLSYSNFLADCNVGCIVAAA